MDNKLPNRTGSGEQGASASTPTSDIEFAAPIDMAALQASAAAAIASERSELTSPPPPAALGPAPKSADSQASKNRGRLWKIALPIGVVAAIATVGVVALGGSKGSTDNAAPTSEPAAATSSSLAPTTTATPTTVAAPTSAPTTTPVTAAPTTPAPAPGLPPHKAIYRGGKLYLEGRIESAAAAQKYVDKASAVLGAGNVVNNYVIDPTVAPSTDGTVYVDEPLLFESGSAAINPQYTTILNLGVAALKLNPQARMEITGHTDSAGDPAANITLSQERADAVANYMVTTGGLDRSRFDAIGKGDTMPVGDNNTEEGKRLNRRIEVKLVNLLG